MQGDQLEALLSADAPESLLELHLRLHYSERCALRARTAVHSTDVARSVRDYLATVDFDALAIERRERIAQLRRKLQPAFPEFEAVATVEEFTSVIERFVDDAIFWNPRGRTLAENFSISAHKTLIADGQRRLADLVKTRGIVSGLGEHPSVAPPWPDVRAFALDRSGLRCEVFVGCSDPLRTVTAASPHEPPDQPSHYSVAIVRRDASHCEIRCLPLGT